MSAEYRALEYGCLRPRGGEPEAVEQMHRRNSLWNALVEIDHKHRALSQKLIGDKVPEQEALDALLAERTLLRDAIQAKRRSARKRAVEITDERARLEAIMAQVKTLIPLAKAARKESIVRNKEALGALEGERREAVKAACAAAHLYWCNYDDVVASYEVARVRALKQGRDLRFHGWRGEGKVSIRYQTGLAAKEAFAGDTRLQIAPVDPGAWTDPSRSRRRRLARTVIRIRVGSHPDRSPVWLELPMVMHRALPENSLIRQASALRERVGNDDRWKVVMVVRVPDEEKKRQGPAIGIDIGWRRMPHGLRIAYWADELGEHGEIVLPETTVSQFEKVRDLQSILDNHFELAKTLLAAWRSANLDRLPEWLRPEIETLAQWRGPVRLMRLYRKWKMNRFKEDKEDERAMEILATFAERYDHLYPWQAHLRDQILKRRREIYRCVVAKLLATHGRVFVEDFDLRSVIKQPAPEQEARYSADRSRFIASPASLINMLVMKGGAEKVPAGHTTLDCSWCGFAGPWDTAESVVHRCGGCGRLFDQDWNAAINILRRGLTQIGAGLPPSGNPRNSGEGIELEEAHTAVVTER